MKGRIDGSTRLELPATSDMQELKKIEQDLSVVLDTLSIAQLLDFIVLGEIKFTWCKVDTFPDLPRLLSTLTYF